MTKKIDVHAHFLPQAYLDELATRAAEQPATGMLLKQLDAIDPRGLLLRLDESRVAAMDEAGVDVQVLSLIPPAAALTSQERAGQVAATLNDALVAAAERFPGRFLVLCSLPYPHVQESVAELDRLAGNPTVRGALIDTHSSDFNIDEPRFDPVYAKLAELQMPAVLHPAFEAPPSFYAYGLHSSLSAMVSTSLAGLRLVLGGTLDRVPGLDLVIPHLGGTIPYLVQRVAELNGRGDAEQDLIYYLRNRIWTDTCSHWHPALRCAIDTFGAERLMLGSDYPFRGSLDDSVNDIATAGLDGTSEAAIFGGAAERWFAGAPRRQ